LFDQIIIFIQSGERKRFADPFYDLDDVKYLTVSKKENEPAELLEGKNIFQSFQDEEQEEVEEDEYVSAS
ncbi:MAG: hypothetical protein ABEH43_06770, partial [Flavobacteriales bacterium]